MRAQGGSPELHLDGVPIIELQPRYNPLEHLLFFSHIPRTAGGTFSVLLQSLFSQDEQMPLSGTGSSVRDLHNFSSQTPEAWKKWKVLFAHEDMSFISRIPGKVATTVFLRDPIKQRRSFFYWGLLQPFRKYDDITSWVLSPDFPEYYQVEWMAGVSRWWPYSHFPEEHSLNVWQNKPLMLRLAKEQLAQTTWFGITERFNESLCLFYYTHRMRAKTEGEHYISIHRYVTQPGSESTFVASAGAYQRPRLEYEYKFFRWAKKLFALRIANMKRDFKENRKAMKDFVAPECSGILT